MSFLSWLFGTRAETSQFATAPGALLLKASGSEAEVKPVWPNTTPIDKTDPYWECNNNFYCNGTQYKKSEVSPGKWQWVVDEYLMEHKRRHQQSRRALGNALHTRVLTEEELTRAIDIGYSLYVEEMVAYMKAEKQAEFDRALIQQYKIRALVGAHVFVSG